MHLCALHLDLLSARTCQMSLLNIVVHDHMFHSGNYLLIEYQRYGIYTGI